MILLMQTDNILKVSVVQTSIVWEDPEANRKQLEVKITKALAHTRTDLVVLPEMFTTGFTMNAHKLAETMQGTTVLWMQQIAVTHSIAITGSLIIKENNNFYNRLLFVYPSGDVTYYDKKHSFTLANEHKTFTSGAEKLIVNYKGWKICPLICYDLRFPVWSRNVEKYDLLLYVASWPQKRIYAWNSLLKARAIENMSYTIGVNRIGLDASKFQYNGHSIVLNTLGEPISEPFNEHETILQVSLSKTIQDVLRQKMGFLNDMDAFTLQKK